MCSFAANLQESHANTVKKIGRFLIGTINQALVLNPDPKHIFFVKADLDFIGNWNKEKAMSNGMTAKEI